MDGEQKIGGAQKKEIEGNLDLCGKNLGKKNGLENVLELNEKRDGNGTAKMNEKLKGKIKNGKVGFVGEKKIGVPKFVETQKWELLGREPQIFCPKEN